MKQGELDMLLNIFNLQLFMHWHLYQLVWHFSIFITGITFFLHKYSGTPICDPLPWNEPERLLSMNALTLISLWRVTFLAITFLVRQHWQSKKKKKKDAFTEGFSPILLEGSSTQPSLTALLSHIILALYQPHFYFQEYSGCKAFRALPKRARKGLRVLFTVFRSKNVTDLSASIRVAIKQGLSLLLAYQSLNG